jgi:error-prone DNA polymerase
LVRSQLDAQRCYRSSRLRRIKGTRPVRTAGLVIGRQRPQTASGLTFVTLEDEDGQVNVIVRLALAERQRRAFLESRLLLVDGMLESVDGVQHLIAERLQDLSSLLGELDSRSRDFH